MKLKGLYMYVLNWQDYLVVQSVRYPSVWSIISKSQQIVDGENPSRNHASRTVYSENMIKNFSHFVTNLWINNITHFGGFCRNILFATSDYFQFRYLSEQILFEMLIFDAMILDVIQLDHIQWNNHADPPLDGGQFQDN